MPGAAPSDCDTWTLDRPVAGRSTAVHQATLFALANGMIGVRGGIEELDRDHATILAEAVQHRPISYHERFPGFADATDTRLLGPGVTALAIAIDGLPIDFSAAEKLHCKRQLCVKTATLSRETDWALPDGRRLRVSTLRLVPIGDAPLCVQVVTIEALNFAGLVELSFPIAMASGGGEACDDPRISAKAGFIPAGSQSNARGHVARFVSGGHGTVHLSVAQALSIAGEFGETDLDRSASARLAPGQCMIVNRLVAVAADDQIACTSLDQARLLGIAALSERHQQALDQWWQQSEIAIEGDARLTLAIRYNLLHLFMSASRSDRHGIAAKGLTGEGYEGHYFWDTEVFVLPVLALMQPALARNVLGYRIARLDKARANARALGHSRGALFPWRTIEGDECSAHYPTGAAQYHVNAAIAFALESYINVTGDHSILTEGAADLLVETARLWADLGHFSARRGGAFLIHGVTGPDEYTALVDNDYYTNAMARQHLRFAVRVMAKLQSEDPLAYAAVADRLALDPAETEHWALAADRMWLPVDPASGVHPQDDSFMEKPEFPGLTDPARRRPLLLSHHPMVLYRHRLCKQGDVIQAHQVAGIECSLAQLQRDYDYYEPLTTHDSTLSMTAFGIAAARLSRDEAALGFHRETALIDIDDLHGNSSHGVHMAAMAGSWLILAQGWAGLRIDGDQAELAPRCPAGWLGYTRKSSEEGLDMEFNSLDAQRESCEAYIRDDSYRAALALLINAHHRLPFSRVWGDGTTSSSDGQFFRAAKRGASGGDINARYGVDHGFSFYTHNSDQRAPYHVKVISAATHEAPYVLDGLTSHGTDLRIVEHYTDTGGATDHVFALCAMLGFRFCPRLRDFPDRRLAPIAPVTAYPSITPLLGKRIRTDIIGEQWEDVLRLVGSIKAGHVAPSVMLRKLAAYERQNQLDVALQEIGKIERTLFMLDWLENPDLRRRCHAGLNNSEQRHALTQAINTFRQGRIIDRSHEAQQYRASGLNLLVAAIVYWNTIYMDAAAQHLRSTSVAVPDDLLAHTSPVGWEHIAFSGDFLWDRAAASAGRKALNLPPDSRAA